MADTMVENHSAIIVDDEPLAIKGIELLLADYPQITVMGTTGTVDGAVRLIRDHAPDLIFLDIQLQGETGFDLMDRIPISARVVFVTAYDAFAVRAFEVNALDYLLKPVSRERFGATLQRIQHCTSEDNCRSARMAYDDVVVLNIGRRMRFIQLSQITRITAEGDYTRVCIRNANDELVSKPMKAWETLLPEQQFVRVHRSTILNMARVLKIEKTTSNRYLAYLSDGSNPLPISQRYAARLRKRLRNKVEKIGTTLQY